MTVTKVTLNLDGLEGLKKDIAGRYKTRVGILGEKAARQGDASINNAELGVIQMFGSITNKIPPRDFLRMPIERNRKNILKEMGTRVVRDALEAKNYKQVFAYLGVIAEKYVQQAFETGGFGTWPPHAPGTKPHALLIKTGQLRRAITSDVVAKGKQ